METDQTSCYTETGSLVSCKGTGQDAAQEKNFQYVRKKRFRVMDRVVQDNLTGATWTKDANLADFPLSWLEAQRFVSEMRERRAYGRGDWQLPTRFHLFALLSHQCVNPAIADDHPFENIFDGYYWSGDACARLPDQAWYVHLGGGRLHRGMKHGSYMLWPVSPGRNRDDNDSKISHLLSSERFIIEGKYAKDTRTDLIWYIDANPFGHVLSWSEAFSVIQAFNESLPGGYGDWRIPNIRELESLVDLHAHSPSLPFGHPFVNVQDVYWSSTTSVYEPRYAWSLYTQDGIIGVGYKSGRDFFAWPVRGPENATFQHSNDTSHDKK